MKKSKAEAPPEKLLTEVELELMGILWSLGEGSVADVIEMLPKERKLAYTSVSTILRILEQKGVLSNRKEGRGHIYIPKIRKDDYEARTLKHVVLKVFDGAPVSLVRQLLNSVEIEPEDLAEIRKLLSEMGDK